MSSRTIASVINYVKCNREFFGFPVDQKITFEDCIQKFRISKTRIDKLQIFDYQNYGTARVFLPAWIEKLSLKEATRKLKDVKFTDFFDGFNGKHPDDWKFMLVSPNRIVFLDMIIRNTMPTTIKELDFENTVANEELEKANEKIKQLEAELAELKKAKPRVMCDYMMFEGDTATIDLKHDIGSVALKVNTGVFNGTLPSKIDNVIENYQLVAAELNDIANNLKRAKLNGVEFVKRQM